MYGSGWASRGRKPPVFVLRLGRAACEFATLNRMTPFTDAEIAACRALIDLALREDLGEAGDLTTKAFIPPNQMGRAAFVARTSGVLAGIPAAELGLRTVDPTLGFQPGVVNG